MTDSFIEVEGEGKKRLFDFFARRRFEKGCNAVGYQKRFGGRSRSNYIHVNS
jgi:hypothetical protein